MQTPLDTAQPGTGLQGRWIAMAVLLIAGFMNLIDVTIVNVALPSLQKAFGATSSQIEWVVAGYILVFALGLLPAGRLGDILGRRRMFVWGVGVFTFGSALCGLAPSMETLVAARVLQGIGGAMMTPQTLGIVPALFAPHERGMAYALFGLSAGLASVTGPLLGGVLIGADIYGLGWRPIFLVNIPVGVIAIFAALRYLPEVPGAKGLKNDFIGIAIAMVALLLVIFPLIEGRQAGWPLWCFAMMAASVPAAVLFVLWQRRQAACGGPQLLPVSLMENANFMVGTGMVMVLFSGIPGFFLMFALYLQNGYGLTPLQSGLTTLPFSVGVLIASVVSGRLGVRWPRRRIAVGGVLLTTAMVWLRIVVQHTVDDIVWMQFAVPLLIGGVGLGTAISPMFQTVLSNIEGRDTGSASGALQSFQQVGGAFGVAIVGEIFFSRLQALGSPAAVPHDIYANAIGGGLLYNIAAFGLVALIVWRLPRPR